MWIIPVLIVGGVIWYLKSESGKKQITNPARRVLRDSGIVKVKPTGRANPARQTLQRAGIMSQDDENDPNA
jgi:hypothetical protein